MINDKTNYEKIIYLREKVTKDCFQKEDFEDVDVYDFYGKTGEVYKNCICGEIENETFCFHFSDQAKLISILVNDKLIYHKYNYIDCEDSFCVPIKYAKILDNLTAEELAKIVLNIPNVKKEIKAKQKAEKIKREKQKEETKQKVKKVINSSKNFLKKQFKKNGLNVDIEKVTKELGYDIGKMLGYYFYF